MSTIDPQDEQAERMQAVRAELMDVCVVGCLQFEIAWHVWRYCFSRSVHYLTCKLPVGAYDGQTQSHVQPLLGTLSDSFRMLSPNSVKHKNLVRSSLQLQLPSRTGQVWLPVDPKFADKSTEYGQAHACDHRMRAVGGRCGWRAGSRCGGLG